MDEAARHLRAQEGEARTLAQLRADVAVGLLGDPGGEARRAKAAVAVTIPALTLLGHGDEPAILDGYGPIDRDTAARLAGDATSWVRILTHPVTGTVLDVDRRTYRVPKPLRRWLGVRDPVCTFPGCGRLARDCDIDHRQEWRHGGARSAGNTGPLCEPHHRVKTETRWDIRTNADSGAVQWVSPAASSRTPIRRRGESPADPPQLRPARTFSTTAAMRRSRVACCFASTTERTCSLR